MPSRKKENYRSLLKSSILSGIGALIFLFFDTMFYGAPLLASFILLYLLFYILPVLLFSLKDQEKLKYFGSKAIIYGLLVVCSFGFYLYDTSESQDRAMVIIDGVDRYLEETGTYPGSLDVLVPQYLSEIKSPRKTGPGRFYYVGLPEDPHLMYVKFPPFGRMSWSFKEREWILVD